VTNNRHNGAKPTEASTSGGGSTDKMWRVRKVRSQRWGDGDSLGGRRRDEGETKNSEGDKIEAVQVRAM
jgi:hypothetical protein